jgi:hypothetical protein
MKNYAIVDSSGYVVGTFSSLDEVVETAPPGTTLLETGELLSVLNGPPGHRLRASDLQWVDVRTLDDCKAEARQAMARAYSDARQGGVTVGTKTAPTTPEAWTRYHTIRLMASEAGWVDVPIEMADGTFEVLTQAKAQTLWTALKQLERDTLARLRDRIEAINAAATIAEVEAVVW